MTSHKHFNKSPFGLIAMSDDNLPKEKKKHEFPLKIDTMEKPNRRLYNLPNEYIKKALFNRELHFI